MFRIRQYIKMFLQNVCLPMLYHFWARRPVQKGKILMADAHHTKMPFSMRRVWEELKKRGREDIMVVIGGVIPAQDYEYLYEHGAAAIFGPGTVIPVAAGKVMKKLKERMDWND